MLLPLIEDVPGSSRHPGWPRCCGATQPAGRRGSTVAFSACFGLSFAAWAMVSPPCRRAPMARLSATCDVVARLLGLGVPAPHARRRLNASSAVGVKDWSEPCEHVVSVQYEPVVRELQEGLRSWSPKASRFLWPKIITCPRPRCRAAVKLRERSRFRRPWAHNG